MQFHTSTKKSVILYWVLLFIPTVVIGAVAFRLLSHEQERITLLLRSSAMDRLSTLAESIRFTVSTIEERLVESLFQLDDNFMADTLELWKSSDPMIRNVFIWDPVQGLKLPRPGRFLSAEDRGFIARYESLFSRRTPWNNPNGEPDSGGNGSTGPDKSTAGRYGRYSERNAPQLFSRSKAGPPIFNQTVAVRSQSGWIPWFYGNKLYLLGWVCRDAKAGPYFGVEIEMVSLYSRIIPLMPRTVAEGSTYTLLDGEGRTIHQIGAQPEPSGVQPNLAVSLAPTLPHWQVCTYFPEADPILGRTRSFLVLGGLLLAIFLTAIVAGGSMLLRQAHRNAVDAMQKTTFVSNVSHELKTPLTNIRMYAELLNSGRIKEPEKRKKYLDVVVAESERLTRLVNNVLDFSRLEQGRKKYRLEDVDIRRLVEDVVETQRLRLEGSNVEIELVSLPGEEVSASIDRDALEQVLLNVIDNAVKYGCGKSPLESRIEFEAVSDVSSAVGRNLPGMDELAQPDEPTDAIVIMLERRADVIDVRIMDRGPGVPVRHRERIFEKFHRVDDSLTTDRPGCGLGLSISRRLLRDLGGDLHYEPRDGGGSVFVVRIPCRRQQ
jgi:signal transduction histidine kinase